MINLMEIGQIILGHYEVIDLICQGGQALIGKATDNQGGTFAVKQLTASTTASNYDEELARFKRSAKIDVGHRGVVDPVDFGEEDGEW